MPYRIQPSIGIARVGNSTDEFYLAPESIGGLPIDCNQQGDSDGSPVTQFKDAEGRIKRQAARFVISLSDDADPSAPATEIHADSHTRGARRRPLAFVPVRRRHDAKLSPVPLHPPPVLRPRTPLAHGLLG